MSRERDSIDSLYKTARWQSVRQQVIIRDHGLCQECLRRKIITRAKIVHHIVEAREDLTLFWDNENLEIICPTCHNKEHPERSGGKKKVKKKSHVVKFYANNE